MLTSPGLIDEPVGWLTNGSTVMPVMIAINIWKMFPFVAIMVLAGLQSISNDLYEAARIDGASFWEEVRYVMLPQVRTVIVAVTLLLVIWALNHITIIYAITRGGPANRTLITPIQIFRTSCSLLSRSWLCSSTSGRWPPTRRKRVEQASDPQAPRPAGLADPLRFGSAGPGLPVPLLVDGIVFGEDAARALHGSADLVARGPHMG
jgi:hypothetical protein